MTARDGPGSFDPVRANEVYLLKTRDVLKRETLADQVAQQLMEHIQNTAMAPGAFSGMSCTPNVLVLR